ncbi:MAG: hypothetical protein JWR63_2002 [Conexibacter sp.]|nr:hypothetical protein [Conexibacter sp.]
MSLRSSGSEGVTSTGAPTPITSPQLRPTEKTRLRYLRAYLREVNQIPRRQRNQIMDSLFLALLYRCPWVGAPVRVSYASLSQSIGKQRPGRAAVHPKHPNKAVRDAGTQLAELGLVTRTTFISDDWRGEPRYAPCQWRLVKQPGVADVDLPKWAEAGRFIRRLARQDSTIGPMAESLLVRLALAVDAAGELRLTLTQLAELCGVERKAITEHLSRLAELGFGIAELERGGKGQPWLIRLEMVPMGDRCFEQWLNARRADVAAFEAHEKELAPMLAAQGAAGRAERIEMLRRDIQVGLSTDDEEEREACLAFYSAEDLDRLREEFAFFGSITTTRVETLFADYL